MPRIEIQQSASGCDGPMAGYGTVIRVDGKELPDVTEIGLKIGIDEAVKVTTTVLATEHLSINTGADLHVTIVPMPGYWLIEEPQPDGSKRYRTEEVR